MLLREGVPLGAPHYNSLPPLPPPAVAAEKQTHSLVTKDTARRHEAHLDIIEKSLASSLPDINVSHGR